MRSPDVPARFFLAFCGALLGPAMARDTFASSVAALDLDALSTRADRIVVGQVVKIDPHFVAPGSPRIVTDVTLRAEQNVLGGDSSADRIVVRHLGGEVGRVGQMVYGEATYFVGERVVLFAAERQGSFFAVGMAQGVLPIAQDAAGVARLQPRPAPAAWAVPGRRVDDLLAEVRGYLNRKARK